MYKILIFLFLILFSGCGLLKQVTRTKEKVITVTEYKIDTVIKVNTDTIIRIKKVFLYDTAYINSKSYVVKSYIDTIKQQLVIEAKGKEFNTPVSIDKKETKQETKKQTESVPKPLLILISIIGLIVLICLVLLILKK